MTSHPIASSMVFWMKSAISVTQLVQYVKRKLDVDQNLQAVYAKGELSNVVFHRSGHWYFTLKDERSKIACVMFASQASKVSFPVENGMQVFLHGSVSMFESSGQVQIYVTSLEQQGIGLLYQQLEELKQRLQLEGLFDPGHKKQLPSFPRSIAVISAKEGAATQDVFTTLRRRWPVARITFIPSLVQGKAAALDLADAIQLADKQHCDVILLVRGGGSIEDLWCFNEEAVLRAVYHCASVVVSGVGHETDTTLVDYVSDLRAPTPTAAAELATPNIDDVKFQLWQYRSRLEQRMQHSVKRSKELFAHIRANAFFKDPTRFIQSKQYQLMELEHSLYSVVSMVERYQHELSQMKQVFLHTHQRIQGYQQELLRYRLQLMHQMQQLHQKHAQALLVSMTKLEAYSPLAVMKKGYVLTYQNGVLQKSIHTVAMEQDLTVRYPDGILTVRATSKEEL